MAITRHDFGHVQGRLVSLYELKAGGLTARISDYGAILTELHVPDAQGQTVDVTLGFAGLEGYLADAYLADCPYFGAMVGRYGNRIAHGRFRLDDREYQLPCNSGPHHLHGGFKGFDKQLWEALPMDTGHAAALELRYLSPDGEQGYPGNLTATVIYTLNADGELRIESTALCDRPTVVNLIHHGYWNLRGDGASIVDHELTVAADRYTPTNTDLIPTGALAPVAGTPYDFRRPKPIGQDLDRLPAGCPGYDINFALNGAPGELRRAVRVREPRSGRVMELFTTAPGMQLYDGCHLKGKLRGKHGVVYHKHAGFCLETQQFPDSPNQPTFPSAVLDSGEVYRHLMVYRFHTES